MIMWLLVERILHEDENLFKDILVFKFLTVDKKKSKVKEILVRK